MKTKRIIYFDLLKIISCFAVVVIHVISEFWYDLNPNNVNFIILTIIDSIIRFAVPIYFMVSGALFLDENKTITIKDIFTKYILKIFIIYVIWNMFYTLGTNVIINKEILTLNTFALAFRNTILGNGIYHLYFLVIIIGFYLCVPILKKITKKENKKVIEYFIILLFVFTSLNNLLSFLFNISLGYPILFGGFALYFILGYYLHNFNLSKKTTYIIYILGLLGIAYTIIGTINYSNHLQKPNEFLFNYILPNIVFISSSVFLLFKNMKITMSEKRLKRINVLSKNYFGIYLIHGLVIGIIEKLGFFNLNLNLSLLIIIGSIICYIISFIIIYIISKIPILKKIVLT